MTLIVFRASHKIYIVCFQVFNTADIVLELDSVVDKVLLVHKLDLECKLVQADKALASASASVSAVDHLPEDKADASPDKVGSVLEALMDRQARVDRQVVVVYNVAAQVTNILVDRCCVVLDRCSSSCRCRENQLHCQIHCTLCIVNML